MIYVTSDLHGYYDKYAELLTRLRLKDSDSLFINGDICGKGPEAFRIMKDALMRCNIFPIMGDNDLRALRLLSRLNNEEAKADPDYLKKFSAWLSQGGMPTVTEFRSLSEEEQADVLDFLREEFVAYDETDAGGRSYVMVHAGLGGFDPARPLENYRLSELVSGEPDFSREYFEDKFLITGHTPTFRIDENARNFIYRRNGQIGINTGVAEGGPLACLCLDTDEEIYI